MFTEAHVPSKSFFCQFTVTTMLLLITGICCYLGGRIHGYRDGIAIWDSVPLVVKVYSVPSTQKAGATNEKSRTLESMALQIKSEIMPGTWEEAGGKSRLVPDTASQRLVVSANQLVHKEIATYLDKLRKHAAAGAGTVWANGFNSQTSNANPSLAAFEFHRAGAASPEDAAKSLFRACAAESPRDFVQHLLLGVCDNEIDTLQKFAECLHTTRFNTDGESFTLYELPKRMNMKKPIRVVATAPFDTQDKQVAALQFQMASTYYGQKFISVDVGAAGYDGREYRMRIVVAKVDDRWYAMPRCRSSKAFYEIADAMELSARVPADDK